MEFGGRWPRTMRDRCSGFRYFPDPLGIVAAKQFDKLEFIELFAGIYPPEGYFLVSEQESTQRSRHRGGIESIAPAIEAIRPYVPHPARTWHLPSILTTENIQTYCLAVGGGCRSRRPADEANTELSSENRNIF